MVRRPAGFHHLRGFTSSLLGYRASCGSKPGGCDVPLDLPGNRCGVAFGRLVAHRRYGTRSHHAGVFGAIPVICTTMTALQVSTSEPTACMTRNTSTSSPLFSLTRPRGFGLDSEPRGGGTG